MNRILETGMKILFLIAACTSVIAVALICVFLFANGVPAMREIGVWDFLSGQLWRPANNIFGILPMIMGSIYVTAGAIVVGVPIGLFTAVFMAHYCPKRIYGICKTAEFRDIRIRRHRRHRFSRIILVQPPQHGFQRLHVVIHDPDGDTQNRQ